MCLAWLVGFVYVFHDYLNIVAEILRFGDREFYKDWWNCRNLGEFWRTWNMPVHNFFVRHVSQPLLRQGYSRHAINTIIFIISAIAHEYMISIAIGGISYWILVSFAMQYGYIIWENYFMKVTKLEDSNLGNFMFWINFCILGQPILTAIYYNRFATV